MQVYDATWVVYKGVLCATIGQQVTAGTVIVKKDASLGGTAENQQMKPEKTSPADQSSRAFQAKLKGKAKVSGNLDERLADAAPARKREAAARTGAQRAARMGILRTETAEDILRELPLQPLQHLLQKKIKPEMK